MAPTQLAGKKTAPFACQYCPRHFKRLEHVQRHERTHTKEVPFECPCCGRAFARRDLLTRHERSAHGRRMPGARRAPTPASSTCAEPDIAQSQSDTPPDPESSARRRTVVPQQQDETFPDGRPAAIADTGQQSFRTGLLGSPPTDGVHHLSDDNIDLIHGFSQHIPAAAPPHITDANNGLFIATQQLSSNQLMPNASSLGLLQDDSSLDGHNLFLDDFDFSFLQPPFQIPVLEPYVTTAQSGIVPDTSHLAQQHNSCDYPADDNNATSLSHFGSPLPSLDPHTFPNAAANKSRRDKFRPFPRKLFIEEYRIIEAKVRAWEGVADNGRFTLPSRHTLSRFFEGCIQGLFEHLPYVHIPTFSIEHTSLDLLLSMAAIGAEFRFEKQRALELFYAARAIIMSPELAPTHDTPHGQDPMLGNSTPTNHDDNVGNSVTSSSGQYYSGEALKEIGLPRQVDGNRLISESDKRLHKIQAILALMVMGSWSSKDLVREALSLQSMLAVLVREDNLLEEDDDPAEYSASHISSDNLWRRWARYESRRRTKLMAFCFLNLQSLAYNIPPMILTSEIVGRLPSSAEEWKAPTEQQWSRAYDTGKVSRGPFQQALETLFLGPSSTTVKCPVSTISNYTMIHAILQRILDLRRAARGNELESPAINEITQALNVWQKQWELSPESNVEPQSATGPVAFNSTPLLRLAWIRLQSDLGPCRNLASRDPILISSAFRNSPPLRRSPKLIPSVLQAAYALSVPVRLGVVFVSKTQTISWSIQHSLCNFDCAIFLSKWFEALALTADQPLSPEEKTLIKMIRTMINESGLFQKKAFSGGVDDSNWQATVHRLATAVARIWAEIYKGTHVFDIVNTIGASLNIYAETLEKTHSPINHV